MIHIIIICTVKIVEFYPKLEDPKTRNGSVWTITAPFTFKVSERFWAFVKSFDQGIYNM